MRSYAAARMAGSFSAGVRPLSAIEKRASLQTRSQSCSAAAAARVEGVLAPELLGIDAMTAFDLAVLIGPARLDANASALDGEQEGEGELRPAVGLGGEEGVGRNT